MPNERFEIHMHHIWSNTRLLDAICNLKDSIKYALELGLKGISITDHGNVCGWIKANQLQKELDEKGIDFKIALGEEGYLTDTREMGIKYYHCIWIAKDKIGAKQIRRMSSIANLNSYFDRRMERVPLLKSELENVVKKNPGHIIVTTACLGGEVSSNILEMETARRLGDNEGTERAKQKIVDFILWAKDLFKDDFYLEVAPSANKDQIIVNEKMVELSKCFNVKIVLGCDVHYLKKEDRYVHEAFLNSRGEERETAQFYEYTYLQSEEEIKANLEPSIGYLYDELCKNSMEIYDKIEKFYLDNPQQIPDVEVEFSPKRDLSDLKNKYPKLYEMGLSDDNIERYWVSKCLDKLTELNKNNDTYLAELEEEAEVKSIVGAKLGTNMFKYPIVLANYIEKFWDLGSPVGVGRGSACSALNHYLLGITQLDPIEWDFPFFRYMNRDTDGLGDIDIDLAPSKVPQIIKMIKAERGAKFNQDLDLTPVELENLGCVYVCTFGTESTKSAIQTACRGYRSEDCPNGIDNDIAQYLSSLIPSERGFLWPLDDVVNGNEEKERSPITTFLNEVEKYPGLLDIMRGIEGIISRKGRHASGVLFLNEDPYEFNAFMKTPSGEVVTQWDLHDAEWAGSTKMDILVTEVQDKIAQTLKLLQESGEIEQGLSLREIYDKYLHPDVLPLKDEKTWEIIDNAAILDLFQLDSDIGRQGAKKVRPSNMIELSSVNGLIRLMNAEKGAESWLDKYVRYKKNYNEYLKDIAKYHLTDQELGTINKYVGMTYGIGISQEQFMRTVMDKDICDFSLKESNKARKVISKKKMKDIPILKEQIFAKAKNKNIANYVWDFVVAPGLGYAFSDIHSTSYSFIGFQTAYLATNWNPVYWNTACLIVNSGSLEDSDKGTDYGKIAKAINTIKSHGISISLVDINKSDYGFKPDAENNTIYYGLKALSNINNDTVDLIIKNRPYSSIKDFLKKCPLTKTAVISLIKAGAFDKFMDRKLTMGWYLWEICDKKKKLTLQNMPGLIKYNLLPEDTEERITARRIYEFNRYLKSVCKTKDKNIYQLDDRAINFLTEIEADNLIDSNLTLKANLWDKIYQNWMDVFRKWIADDKDQILYELNAQIYLEEWNHYARGTISTWEMQSMCFYYHEHELANVQKDRYGIVNFNDLENEKIDYMLKRNGRQIPIYELVRIIGTVIAKNDTRHSITLLTPDGVVNVKMTGELYAMYKKQISQVQADGTKKVIEKSWFTRGTMLMLQGFKRDDTFVTKSYSRSLFHQIYKIDNINEDNTIELRHERAQGVAEDEAV